MILLWNSSISIMGDRCNPSHHRLEKGSSGHLMLIISGMKTNWNSCKDISQAKEKRSSGPLSFGQHHQPPNRAQHQTIRESEPVVWGQIFVHRPIIWSRRPERVWRAGSPRQQPPTDEPSVAVQPASSEHLPARVLPPPDNFSESIKIVFFIILWKRVRLLTLAGATSHFLE